MENITSKLIIAGFAFILMFASGIWLSHLGKPYGQLLFTMHKLTALAAVIFFVLWAIPYFKTTYLTPFTWVLCILAIVLVLLLFVTGGIISAGKNVPDFMLKIHETAPKILLVSLVLFVLKLIRVF